jgi:ElaB/YqjD/DUF883 family membrane-anchored ribosome-binding protein
MSIETDRIEADVQQSRHRLKDTLSELGSKISPGQLLDEGIGLIQGTAGQFAGKLGRQVRDNPLPILLVGAGIAWLVVSSRQNNSSEDVTEDEYHRRRYRTIEEARWATPRLPSETDEAYEDRVHDAYVKALDLKQMAGEAAHEFKARVKSTIEGIQYAATRAGARVKRTLGGTGRRLSGAYTGARERVGTLASDAKHVAEEQAGRLSHAASDARHRVEDFYEESPLAIGAIALGIGALIGGAAPLSQPERRTLRGVADKAVGAGADLVDRGVRAVEERLDNVH